MVGTFWYFSNKTFKIQISYSCYLVIWCMISVYTIRTTITLCPFKKLGKWFFDTMVSKKIFTPPLKKNWLFPVSYSKFHYPCIQTHFFLKLTLSPRKLSPPLPESFLILHWISAPPKLCPHEAMDWTFILSLQLSLPRRFFLYRSFVSPKLSPREAMACLMFESVSVGVDLMFERVDFNLIWVLFGFGNGFRFDVWSWVWLYLWGFGWF